MVWGARPAAILVNVCQAAASIASLNSTVYDRFGSVLNPKRNVSVVRSTIPNWGGTAAWGTLKPTVRTGTPRVASREAKRRAVLATDSLSLRSIHPKLVDGFCNHAWTSATRFDVEAKV